MIDALLAKLRHEALDDSADPDAYWALVEQLWDQDPRAVWSTVRPLADDADPRLQTLAVDVVSQLGREGQPLFFETLGFFQELVARGPDTQVLSAIAQACEHFFDPQVISLLAPFATHPDAGVREGVLHAIRISDKPEAISALITLSTDAVDELREWATYALGSQRPLVDSPAVRDALAARLTDAHGPTRDEAIVGLGLRADARALGPLRAQLERGFTGVALFEAAAALASPVLAEPLRALADAEACTPRLTDEERATLSAALLACVPPLSA